MVGEVSESLYLSGQGAFAWQPSASFKPVQIEKEVGEKALEFGFEGVVIARLTSHWAQNGLWS